MCCLSILFLQYEGNVSLVVLSNIGLKLFYHRMTFVRELTPEDTIVVSSMFVCST